MALHDLVANGGKLLVIGGHNRAWAQFRDDPRIEFVTGDKTEIARYVQSHPHVLPSNCKAVICSRFIGHRELGQVVREVRKRGLVFFPQRNDGEVARLLAEIVNPPAQPARKEEPVATATAIQAEAPAPRLHAHKPQKGELVQFVMQAHQPDLPNLDEARRLLPLAEAAGLRTTLGSVDATVRIVRRRLGVVVPAGKRAGRRRRAVVPAADAEPKPRRRYVRRAAQAAVGAAGAGEAAELCRMLDDAITAMQLVRERVDAIMSMTTKEQRLRERIAALLGEGA